MHPAVLACLLHRHHQNQLGRVGPQDLVDLLHRYHLLVLVALEFLADQQVPEFLEYLADLEFLADLVDR